MTYTVPWWSPSKLVCWDACPQEFYRRYVLHEPMVPTQALHFGTAIHRGLEAHYRGADGDLAFRQSWRQLSSELQQSGLDVAPNLFRVGLDLIEKVVALNLTGEPEKKIWVRTEATLLAPILGYADLWCPDTHTIIDFKSTVGAWSAARAEKEIWQPCLYSYSYWLDTGVLPTFEYIVLNRVTGALDRFTTQRSHDQISDALSRIREIALQVKAEQFDCACRTGFDCPECGNVWDHGHVCDLSKTLRIRLTGAAA